MRKIKTDDVTEIFFKDWGTEQPIVFHHGWPLSADEWDSPELSARDQRAEYVSGSKCLIYVFPLPCR
jgi:pimeloyl-ACP methyl ester carboxylesterase